MLLLYKLINHKNSGASWINTGKNNMRTPLTVNKLQKLVGKTISWEAEAASGNSTYKGIATITNIDIEAKRPIQSNIISGDNLAFAFVDNHGLTTSNEGKTYQVSKENESDYCLSYSDSYREIFFEEYEN
jgi:hypothetical protein